MDGTVLKSISLLLISWIGEHTDYNVPEIVPEVRLVKQAELVEKACNRSCPIRGWYPSNQPKGEEIIYLVEDLDPRMNIEARGILLHELVHFVQDHNRAFINGDDSPKVVYTYREMEATRLEQLYKLKLIRERKKSSTTEAESNSPTDL